MNAVVTFLCLHVEPFRNVTDLTVIDGQIGDGDDGRVTLARVREMLSVCPVEEVDLDVSREIYTAGHQTDMCTLVLTGRLKIVAGVEGFTSESGPFSVLAVGSLTSHKNRGSYHAAYVVDFTATVLERTRLLRIERGLYERLISGDSLNVSGRGEGVNTSPSLLSRQPSTGMLRAEEAGMMAREISSPRARSLSGRLTTPGGTAITDSGGKSTPQPGAKASVGGAKKKMAPLDIGASGKAAVMGSNMGSVVGAVEGASAEARLQAATQLRKLNRNSRSNSQTETSSRLKGRAPSPEVLQSVSSESLMPGGEPSMHHTPASGGGAIFN